MARREGVGVVGVKGINTGGGGSSGEGIGRISGVAGGLHAADFVGGGFDMGVGADNGSGGGKVGGTVGGGTGTVGGCLDEVGGAGCYGFLL
ncbi:hypothetical protein AGMMS49593_03090 [Endomicrobiia bacterium]|nr:hypothetical protein AGMMS49593_03090 [Endomicrobiia bacterium]